MPPTQTLPRSRADAAWKHILNEYFQPFMEFFYPDVAKKIDWAAGYDVLDQELLKLTPHTVGKMRYVDKLVRVKSLDGKPFLVLLHIEVQATRDRFFGRRVFQYYYRLFDRYDLPILTLAILADKNRHWKPCNYTQEVWGHSVLHFQFLVNKLLDYEGQENQLVEMDNPFGTVVAVHLASLKTRSQLELRYASKLSLTRKLYDKGLKREAIIALYHFIDGVLTLPEDLETRYNQFIIELEQERNMAYMSSIERLGMKRGFEQGQQEGQQQGRQEGREEALETTVINMLKKHLPMDLIASVTGFTEEKILALAKKLQLY